MPKAWDIRAWTYDADLHCLDCAHAAGMDDTGAEDSEGNKPHPVFNSDESPASGEWCGDCGEELSEPYNERDTLTVLREWSLISGHDEETGSATEGAGWAALFVGVTADELREAGLYGSAHDGDTGFILTVDTQGFYDFEAFTTDKSARDAWAEVVAVLNPEGVEDKSEIDPNQLELI